MFFSAAASTWEDPDFFSAEQSLMHALVGKYEPSVRPVFNASAAVDVRLGLTLTQILDLVRTAVLDLVPASVLDLVRTSVVDLVHTSV